MSRFLTSRKGKSANASRRIKASFLDHLDDDFARTSVVEHHGQEANHGRVEEHRYCLCDVTEKLAGASSWKGLAAAGVSVDSTEQSKGNGIAVRYYIVSKRPSEEQFATAVRDHWGIDNSCHWQLDVTFEDNQYRIRKGIGDASFCT